MAESVLKIHRGQHSSRLNGGKSGPRPAPDRHGLRRSGVDRLPTASAAGDRLFDEEARRKWNEARRLCPWLTRDEMGTVEQLANAASHLSQSSALLHRLLGDPGKLEDAAKARILYSSFQQLVFKLSDTIGLVHPGRARYLKMWNEIENEEIDEFAV